jgi:hypothetical protein
MKKYLAILAIIPSLAFGQTISKVAQIGDGTTPTQKAAVSAGGALSTADSKLPSALGLNTSANSLPVTLPATSTLLQNAATSTGNGTILDVQGMASVGFYYTSTGGSTNVITLEGTIDGTNWITLPSIYNTSSSGLNSTFNGGAFGGTQVAYGSIAGFKQIRGRVSSYTNGTITLTSIVSAAPPNPAMPLPVSITGNIFLGNDVGDAAAHQATFYSGAFGSSPLSTLPYLWNGASADRQRTPAIFKVINAVTITSETTIWTPATGKKFRLMGYQLMSGATGGNVLLKDNTAGTTILIVGLNVANAQASSPPNMGNGILSAAANNVLTATGATGQTITGFVFGTEE